MKLNTYIDETELKELVKNKVSFKDCIRILNVSSRTLKKYRKLYELSLDRITKNLKGNCEVCNTLVEYKSTKEKKVYCSEYCSHKREHSEITKEKISKSLTVNNNVIINCQNCNKERILPYKKRNQKTCSQSCAMSIRHKNDKELGTRAGLASVKSQNRRSKNEVSFYELCCEYFNNVKHNEPIFNGWDADIIILDHKIAVLWNGKWHYEKITKAHSLKQVKNRDNIKLKEIIKFGYTPYIIKDMGRFSIEKVNDEFNIFLNYIKKTY